MALTDLAPIRATPVNVIEATRATYDELRKSERKVANVLLADPRRMLSPRPLNLCGASNPPSSDFVLRSVVPASRTERPAPQFPNRASHACVFSPRRMRNCCPSGHSNPGSG